MPPVGVGGLRVSTTRFPGFAGATATRNLYWCGRGGHDGGRGGARRLYHTRPQASTALVPFSVFIFVLASVPFFLSAFVLTLAGILASVTCFAAVTRGDSGGADSPSRWGTPTGSEP